MRIFHPYEAGKQQFWLQTDHLQLNFDGSFCNSPWVLVVYKSELERKISLFPREYWIGKVPIKYKIKHYFCVIFFSPRQDSEGVFRSNPSGTISWASTGASFPWYLAGTNLEIRHLVTAGNFLLNHVAYKDNQRIDTSPRMIQGSTISIASLSRSVGVSVFGWCCPLSS